jgi:hypothetical protein
MQIQYYTNNLLVLHCHDLSVTMDRFWIDDQIY